MKLHANARAQPERAPAVGAPGRRGGVVADGGGRGRRGQRAHVLEVGARAIRAEGEAGLLDRSSAPQSVPHRTPEDRVEAIAALRRLRLTGAEIAERWRWRSRRSRRS